MLQKDKFTEIKTAMTMMTFKTSTLSKCKLKCLAMEKIIFKIYINESLTFVS